MGDERKNEIYNSEGNKYYNRCYIETLENMVAAQKFYEKYGFERINEPIVKTEHFACDNRRGVL